jgi:hypothetical protein
MFDDAGYQLIGVMPPGFNPKNEIFVPFQRKFEGASGTHFMPVYARLKPGVTLEHATAEMRTLGTRSRRNSRPITASTCARTAKWWWATSGRPCSCSSAPCSACC